MVLLLCRGVLNDQNLEEDLSSCWCPHNEMISKTETPAELIGDVDAGESSDGIGRYEWERVDIFTHTSQGPPGEIELDICQTSPGDSRSVYGTHRTGWVRRSLSCWII